MFIEEWDPSAGQSRIRLAGEFHRERATSRTGRSTNWPTARPPSSGRPATGATSSSCVRPSAPMTWTTSTSPSCATPTSPCPCAIRTRQSWSTAIPGCCRTRPSRRRAGRQILAPITTSGRDVPEPPASGASNPGTDYHFRPRRPRSRGSCVDRPRHL
jgi:hypothetical protein